VLFHAWFDVVLSFAASMVAPSDYALLWWLLLAVHAVAAIVVIVGERWRLGDVAGGASGAAGDEAPQRVRPALA